MCADYVYFMQTFIVLTVRYLCQLSCAIKVLFCMITFILYLNLRENFVTIKNGEIVEKTLTKF